MNTPLEKTAQYPLQRYGKPKNPKTKTYVVLFLAWILLIGFGAMGAKLYTDHLKKQITTEIASQMEAQLASVEENYQTQISQLKDSLNNDMGKLQGKVDSVNELLAFTKDSANSKTDSSNQLYTQLAEVKKKLDDLKKQLDALQ